MRSVKEAVEIVFLEVSCERKTADGLSSIAEMCQNEEVIEYRNSHCMVRLITIIKK